MQSRHITFTIRLVIAGTLTAAAVGKLLDPTSGLVTPRIVSPEHALHAPLAAIETMAPYLELLIAGSLLTGFGLAAGALAATALSLVFVAYAMLLPDGERCHCFGAFGGFGTRSVHLVVTVTLFVVSCILTRLVCSGESSSIPTSESKDVAHATNLA